MNLIAENEQTNDITPNNSNVLPCIYSGPITHIRFRPIPGKIHLLHKFMQLQTIINTKCKYRWRRTTNHG